MTWSNRICITWSLIAIGFSFGCAMHGQVNNQTETVIHFVCVGFHVAIIGTYVEMYRRTLKGNSPNEPES